MFAFTRPPQAKNNVPDGSSFPFHIKIAFMIWRLPAINL